MTSLHKTGLGTSFRSDEEGRLRALRRLRALDASPEPAFEHIVGLVKTVFDAPICAISLVDSDRQYFLARRGLDLCETGRDVSFCSCAIERPEPLVIEDAAADPRFRSNRLVTGAPFIRSYAGVPLLLEDGYQIGALCVIDVKPRSYTPEQVRLLGHFAANVVHELELRLTAISDPLTGLLNRRGWMSVAQSTFDRARREGAPLSAAILDLDRFKAINDAFGHPAGDAVLRSLAAVGRETLDDEQILGRIGGEEFGLLLPGLGVQQGVQTAERLRRAFAAVSHRLPEPVHCTLSVGVAERDLADPGLDALLSRADRALYEAKRAGRDRTMIGWPPASPRRTALA